MNVKTNRILFSKPAWPPHDKFWVFWNAVNDVLLKEFSNYSISYSNVQAGMFGNRKTEASVSRETKLHDLFIAHHLPKKYPKCLDYKMAYLPSLFYFGNDGYSGFSNIAKANLLDDTVSQSVCDSFYENRILPLANETKYFLKNTSPIEPNLPSSFFFIPLQVQNDSVMSLAAIKTDEMIHRVLMAAKQLNMPVVVKPHPYMPKKCKMYAKVLMFAQVHNKLLYISNADVRQLIDRSEAVFLVNSGVGFEALMKLKRVYTFGTSDYQQATEFAYDDKQIISSLNKWNDTNKIKRVLYNWWQRVIDMNDPRHVDKIRSVINGALNENQYAF